MMGKREIAMKFFSALAVGLLLAGPVSAQDFFKGMDAYKAGDYATALQELRPLAVQGNPNAQTQLGVMYNLALGVPQDYAEAAKFYRLAAEQGQGKAQISPRHPVRQRQRCASGRCSRTHVVQHCWCKRGCVRLRVSW